MPEPRWESLARVVAGEVVLPGAPGYEQARAPQVARFKDVRPAVVVRCRAPADVAEALAFARRSRLLVALRSGGHCFAGGSTTDGLLLDVSPMAEVALEGGLARVGAGARLGSVYAALSVHGMAIPAGCGPTVGISGLTLGGGLGVLGRRHGLTSDRLRAAEVVLADGRMVTCDEDHHADLLWALRGAGAEGLGVVTSLVFEPVPAPRATAFRVLYPFGRAADVLRAWQAWAPVAPRAMAASLLLTVPGEGDAPPAATVFGAMAAPQPAAAEQLEALSDRVGAAPAAAELREAPLLDVKRLLSAGDDRDGGEEHAWSRSEFFDRPLPSGVVDALVRHLTATRTAGEARELDFTPWGGAYGDLAEDATAFAHRGARFLLKQGVALDPTAPARSRAAAQGWLEASYALTRPSGSGRVYPNFPDLDLARPGRAYYAGNLDRVRRVKAIYDPEGRLGRRGTRTLGTSAARAG